MSNMKNKILDATIFSIKFKLIFAIVVVQFFSSYIGQGVNYLIEQSRKAFEKIGFSTDGNALLINHAL